MGIKQEIYCSDRKEWHKWLMENGEREKEVWLIYYKKHTGKPRVPYNEAVEEAICFGWIDSTIRRLDDDRFCQRFTPRKKGSSWSEHNIRRANQMIKDGKITKPGLTLFNEWKSRNEQVNRQAPTQSLTPPDELMQALNMNKVALKNFAQIPPSCKRNYIRWIIDAKKEETRLRRIEKAVVMIEKNIKSFM